MAYNRTQDSLFLTRRYRTLKKLRTVTMVRLRLFYLYTACKRTMDMLFLLARQDPKPRKLMMVTKMHLRLFFHKSKLKKNGSSGTLVSLCHFAALLHDLMCAMSKADLNTNQYVHISCIWLSQIIGPWALAPGPPIITYERNQLHGRLLHDPNVRSMRFR